MRALTERIGEILRSAEGPAGALEALPSVRGASRGEGEALELLAIDGAATNLLAGNGDPAATVRIAEGMMESLERAAPSGR